MWTSYTYSGHFASILQSRMHMHALMQNIPPSTANHLHRHNPPSGRPSSVASVRNRQRWQPNNIPQADASYNVVLIQSP